MREKPIRKQIRLDGYDYSSVGAYFVTICTKDRKKLFWAREDAEISASPVESVSFGSCGENKNLQSPVGAITEAYMLHRPPASYRLSDIGMQVQTAIENIPKHYNDVYVDCYCIMPDHVHMILCILPPDILFCNNDGRRSIYASVIAPTKAEIWRLFADGCYSNPSLSRMINQFKGSVTKQIGQSIWQKSFYDRIVRNRNQMKIVRRYIADNPLRRETDHGEPGDFDAFLTPLTE